MNLDKTTKIFLGIIAAVLLFDAIRSLMPQSSPLGLASQIGSIIRVKDWHTGMQQNNVISVRTASTSIMSENVGVDMRQICISASSSASTILSLNLSASSTAFASTTAGFRLASSTSLCTPAVFSRYSGPVFGQCNQSCWADVLDY